MITIAEKSLNSSKWFQNIPISIPEYLLIKDIITKECRWYIMGRISERAKITRKQGESVEELLTRLGQEMGCSEPTLRRFVKYSIAIDYLRMVEPAIALEIISGKLRMSVENLICLASKSHTEIPITVNRIKSGDEKLYEIFPERTSRNGRYSVDTQIKDTTGMTVKDMPKYDPDAQAMELAYTIPSWVNSINRVLVDGNMHAASSPALKRLLKELVRFKKIVELMAQHLPKETCGGGSI